MGEVIELIQSSEPKSEAKVKIKPSQPKWESDSRERVKSAIKKHIKSLAELRERDANEADTRLFVTDFLCEAFGLDKYKELSTEYRVKGEYADYGVRIDNDMMAFVEVKRLNTKLGVKHLRQVQTYAVNEGVEWIMLTNGAEWQVYHLSGGLPLITDLAFEVDLLSDAPLAEKVNSLFYLTRESFKRGKISELWKAKRATAPNSLAKVVLSEPVITAIRKELKRTTGYNVEAVEIAQLLNTTCLRPECFEK